MNRIGVFGGSFDPPHLGHQRVITEVLERQLVDEMWLLPVQNHPFDKSLSPAQHRVAMLELMLQDLADPRVKIETYELHQQTKNFTFQTLNVFKQQYPDCNFIWIMGSDQLGGFSSWYEAEALVAGFEVVVYPRIGGDLTQIWPGMTALRDLPMMTVSSTQVRQALAQGESVEKLVLPQVAEYSKIHHLYA